MSSLNSDQINIIVSQERKLLILTFLESQAQYSSNADIIRKICDAMGVAVSVIVLMDEIQYLEKNGYVVTKNVEWTLVITLTQAGCEIVKGVTHDENISRPSLDKFCK